MTDCPPDGPAARVPRRMPAAHELEISRLGDCTVPSPFLQSRKQFTTDAVAGKVVTIHALGRDRYGRTLAVVILPDGGHLNRQLVEAGMAWWYEKYAPEDAALSLAQRDAQRAKRGLWNDPSPMPPWEWRRQKRK